MHLAEEKISTSPLNASEVTNLTNATNSEEAKTYVTSHRSGQQRITLDNIVQKVQRSKEPIQQKTVQTLARKSNRLAQQVVARLKNNQAVARQVANTAPSYKPVENSARLINVNNPEPIGLDRIASEPRANAKWKPQPALILKLNDLTPGKYRVGYEHENKTHMPLTYMFGIISGSNKLNVVRLGQGHVDNDDQNLPQDGSTAPAGQRGGVPIAQMLNEQRKNKGTKINLTSGRGFITHVIYETNVPAGDGYFNGMVEFEVQGEPFTFVALAVEQGKAVSPSAKYLGPKRSNKTDDMTSGQGNNRQNRVYNGVSPTSELAATADFEITAAHKPGAKLATWYTNDSEVRQKSKGRKAADKMIPIFFPLRDSNDPRTGNPDELKRQHPYPVASGAKVKHPEDTVGLVGNATTNDLYGGKQPLFATPKPTVDIKVPLLNIPIYSNQEDTKKATAANYQRVDGSGTPGGQDLSLLSNGKQLPANLANFWHVYKLAGTVINKDNQPHTFSIDVTGALKSNTHFAYKAADGSWKSKHRGGKGIPFAYFVVKVPANQKRSIDAEYALGAPSVGNLEHNARVDEVHNES